MQKKSLTTEEATVSPISYVYFSLFFISGISGLIYESIWSQYLKQFLGHAAYAQTLVLMIYMGGMALGSWLVAHYARRMRDLLFAYAIVEILLGSLALVFHNLFVAYLDASFTTVIPFLNKPVPISLYKWITASLIILPQSMLLGATFPLMAGGILRRFPGLSGYKTSFIYFVNTLGASVGVLISGFYLVKEWGLKGAIISGGMIDLFVGVCILALCLNDRNNAKCGTRNAECGTRNLFISAQANAECINGNDASGDINNDGTIDILDIDNIDITKTDPAKNNGGDIPQTPALLDKRDYYYPLMLVSCGTAAASFIYEIGWIRMLSLVLGSSTHSFELMLSAFILGLALGSFFVRNRLDKIGNAPRFLGIVQVIMGATAIATLFVYGNMFEFMVFTMDGLDKTQEGYVFFNVISHVICMVMMLPSTICAGMVIPLIIHMLYRKGYGEESIGKVYAVNTMGGILGVVIATWVLMELVGLKFLIIIGGALDMAIGLYVLYHFAETRHSLLRTFIQPACLLAFGAALAFTRVDPVLISSGVFRYGTISTGKTIKKHIDGKTASITLFKSGDNLVLSTNGKPDASVGMTEEYSSDEYTMALLGLLPLTVHEDARTVAVIGLGAGMTAHYMLYDPTIEQVDVVEIERAVVKLSQMIGEKVENTFNDPRCNIYIEDAKTFFAAQNRTYDIIVSEPSNPWVSGVSSLFSREFFKNIRRHLNDGGILMQWFHSYEADVTILASILKALGEWFPQYELYRAGSDLLIVAAKDEGTDISVKRDVFMFGAIADNMTKMGFTGIDDIRHLRYGSKKFLDPFMNSYPTPANSDYHSYVDLYAVKHRFMGNRVEELDQAWSFIVPVQKMVFADTGFISFMYKFAIPDIPNLHVLQQAKIISQELMIGANDENYTLTDVDAVSGSIFILDYANTHPHMISFEQIQGALIQILNLTLPYLSADEMRDVWDALESKISGKEFVEYERDWIDYLRALCYYDMREIRRLSFELMPDSDKLPDHYSNQMLLTSMLASSAALGDTTKIDRVWSRYTERADPPAQLRAAMALLGLDF